MVGIDEVALNPVQVLAITEEPTNPTLTAMEVLVSLFFECFFRGHVPARLEVIVLNAADPEILFAASFDPDATAELMEQFQFSLWRTSMMTAGDIGITLHRMLEPILRAFADQGMVLLPSVTAHTVTRNDATVLYLNLG